MNTVGVELIPQEKAVFSYHYGFSGDLPQKLVECDGDAYQWNANTSTFDYSRRLSARLKQVRCRQAGRQ